MSVQFINGNMASAQAVKLARVQVVAAYPITPQTHTVEYLSEFVANGELDAQLTKVESEHSALSACAGASCVGARAFTASCSQGLALMAEVLYFTSGMRFPVVMSIANRTLSVPVNIWCDHQDTMVNRDSGWVQLYAGTVQEVYDLTLAAFKIAEDDDVLLPVMVAYDGFILSHACEPVVSISQEQADEFLPPPGTNNRPILDPANPVQFGEVLFPDWYPGNEYKKHMALVGAYDVIERAFADLGAKTGRTWKSVESIDCDDAEIMLFGVGSMMKTAHNAAAELRSQGQKVGVVHLRTFRPFPDEAVREALATAKTVIVLDRDIGYGTSGMVYPDVTRVLYHSEHRPRVINCIIGTGGKDITPSTIERCVELVQEDHGDKTVFWPDARGPEEGIPYTPGLSL
ncbi:MAG: pyruvate ferredoxin oxidoreductase [Proteobacteria bacterium]|jgi:pyruvate ferredoxin oxidoreductase alpha subunit|nr:pyruvate ferredoxin oxidoreductase [Pseudomonadota bacterium]